MTYAMSLNNFVFSELTSEEIISIDGGGWTQNLAAVAGGFCIGFAPVVGVVAGLGASVVGTPIIGVSAGIGAASGMVAAGAAMMDYACQK